MTKPFCTLCDDYVPYLVPTGFLTFEACEPCAETMRRKLQRLDRDSWAAAVDERNRERRKEG